MNVFGALSCDVHSITSFMGKVSGLVSVRCDTSQLMSLPLSAGVGTNQYSLFTVTVLSELSVFIGVVPLPPTEVTQGMVAGGRPLADSQRATTTGAVPACTVTVEAVFEGLAGTERKRCG